MQLSKGNILFIVENDYFPRDMRVFNECVSLSSEYRCYVLAPRGKGEKFVERIKGITCYRFPSLEAKSMKGIIPEYLIAAVAIGIIAPLLVMAHRIKVIHAANPPDFVIPILSWLKLLKVAMVYDVHDLSLETFKGKRFPEGIIRSSLEAALRALELMSISMADAIIATNRSIYGHVMARGSAKTNTVVVRNSNRIVFRTVAEVAKQKTAGPINIGFFGKLGNDEAAGLENFFVIARALTECGTEFKFSIVGDGPGLGFLKDRCRQHGLADRFEFYGFLPIPEAFEIIKEFDFGLVAWGYMQKNHFHTAMKVMDYMCCAVPVCSLRLREQINSTGNIGIIEDTFEEIAHKMVDVYRRPAAYDALRRHTLQHFNESLGWETQEAVLRQTYAALLSDSGANRRREDSQPYSAL